MVLMNPDSSDPLLSLYGSGRDLWADENADEYVRRLRAGWDEAAEPREGQKRPATDSSWD